MPTNVSAFTNDAGYLTSAVIPTNVSAFTNDAGYLTSYTETDPQFTAWTKDYNDLTNKPTLFSGNYNDLTNKPTIPTVPTNVSSFTNDAGYLSNYTETDPQFTAWTKDYNDLTNKPMLFSGNYNDLTNKPTIPTVPTNVSSFTNDAGYITSYTETDPQFTAWTKDYNDLTNKPTLFSGNYNDLTNKPTIPTVPTNVSSFTNDAGYLTSYTETDPQFAAWTKDYNDLTNKPTLFSGNYNDLTNKPTIPTVPTNVSSFTNDAGYLTSYTETDPQFAAWTKDYNDLTNKPTLFSGNYNDLTNKPAIPTVPTNVSNFINDAGYLTSYTETQTLADVAANSNAVNAQIKNLSDPTEAMDAVNKQTLDNAINMLIHKYDSIFNYQQRVIDTLRTKLYEYASTSGDTIASECNSFTWYGNTYTSSGNYSHTLINSAGFDSILTLHLTIIPGSFNTETQEVCDELLWHGTLRTSSNTYIYTYNNAEGCLSADTLHLTIKESSSVTDLHSACDSYTWINGMTYTESNNTATFTLTNSVGCDSIVSLNLTINHGTHNVESYSTSGSYTWHGQTYSSSGEYIYYYTNGYNCPSSDTLKLTIVVPVSIPVFNVSGTNCISTFCFQMVSITTSTPGATIYYTTDGSTPTTSSSVYSSSLTVGLNNHPCIKAIAVKDGVQSEVAVRQM